MAANIVPNLSVSDGVAAIEFYQRAFDATVLFRIGDPRPFAELDIDGARIFVAHESHPHRNFSPTHLGGTTVRIDLLVDDPDALHAQALASGATLIEAMTDHDVGPRMGVVEDPFGHRWLIGRHWTGRHHDDQRV